MLRWAAFFLVTSCVSFGTAAATTGNDCAAVAVLRIEDANLLSASIVPASGDLPEHCRVLGSGKLIVYHGWADPIVTPWRTLQYVEDVQRRMGGAEKTDSFLRLFMLPGFDHCGMQTGPGANDAGFDPLPALEAWVERGVAPDSIPGARIGADGAVQWSRPACPYPESAGCGP
jgi:hypothetical protein